MNRDGIKVEIRSRGKIVKERIAGNRDGRNLSEPSNGRKDAENTIKEPRKSPKFLCVIFNMIPKELIMSTNKENARMTKLHCSSKA